MSKKINYQYRRLKHALIVLDIFYIHNCNFIAMSGCNLRAFYPKEQSTESRLRNLSTIVAFNEIVENLQIGRLIVFAFT